MNKRRTIALLALILAFALILVACGGGGQAEPAAGSERAGDAARGESLYKQTSIGAGSAPGCITCHSLEEGVTLVGPPHAGIGSRAAAAVSSLSSEAFLRQSIVEPNAVVTEGFTAGGMYQNYGTDLSEREISDLVAFLLTLK